MGSRAARMRAVLLQAVVVGALVALVGTVVYTTYLNLTARGIPFGLDFLGDRAGFMISESVLPYSPDDSNWWAVVAGIGNTLWISVVVSLVATVLGTLLALARTGANPLLAALARAWIEAVRNTPVVLLLIFLYTLWWALPPDAAIEVLPGLYVGMRGFTGLVTLTPEVATILVGLIVYTTGFIAEIVRAGLQAVPRGQWEAARALGLRPWLVLRLVIMPQMLRVILPPMTSQYINVIKNSTLAIVVGYSDFMTVVGTIINKTSHAIEGTVIIVATYLVLNLSLSALLNWYNRRIEQHGR